MRRTALKILSVFCLIALTSCLKEDALKVSFQGFSPASLDDGWEIADPTTVGMDSEALKEVYKYVHEDNTFMKMTMFGKSEVCLYSETTNLLQKVI